MIPLVTRQKLEEALSEFDLNLRSSPEFENWEQNKAQNWALEHQTKKYPPKKIISIATGLPVNGFSGGKESNDYLATLGFTVNKLRELSLRETLILIITRYPTISKTEAFGGSHEIRELFNDARSQFESSQIVQTRPNIIVKASYGKGGWTSVPHISLLDIRETKTTQAGTYPVYIFHEDGKGVSLKFGQGVKQVEDEFGKNAAEVLRNRAAEIRLTCEDLASSNFSLSGNTDRRDKSKRAVLYEASTIVSKYYSIESMPSDEELFLDLEKLMKKYDGYVDAQIAKKHSAYKSNKPLALIGTWHEVNNEIGRIKEQISRDGHWASAWSFPIKEDAIQELKTPFNLYIYAGKRKLVAKLRIDEFATSRGNQGIESPWGEITDKEFLGKTKIGLKKTDVLKSWFKVSDIEKLEPNLPVDGFETVSGLSNPQNLLNQNSFGYIYDEEPVEQLTTKDKQIFAKVIPESLPIEWLVDKTGLSKTVLEEIVESILGESPQIILAGPPGTSKTWVAQKLAEYLTRNRPDQARFVQFHPSYGYESFIEGLRPVNHSSGVSFELTPGVVKEVVNAMEKTSSLNKIDDEYVIIIDEANRANLPRVLGELMFLFEYRNQKATLQYSGPFSLPSNLKFIATMNTADRSIRSIDVALRRRFDVFELAPDSTILANFHKAEQTSTTADLISGFESLNELLIEYLDRHHTIGHAFFMKRDLSPKSIRHIWHRKIYPLIEEFFFDRQEMLEEFQIEKFWPSTRNNA